MSLRYRGNICISGLTASGKTTHSHLLAGQLGLIYVSGSQIQLNFSGLSPIQSRDFWIRAEAQALWNERDFQRIDAELLKIEETAEGAVFDTSTMPWRHRRDALCIWLGSSIESRIHKAIVSHRDRGGMPLSEYPALIARKDAATCDLYKALYGIDIGADFEPFQLVIDIGPLIDQPTLDASQRSINAVQALLLPAAAAYLTGRQDWLARFRAEIQVTQCRVIKDQVSSQGSIR